MIKDIVAANESMTLNDKEIEVLKENFPSCFRADGSFDVVRFSEYLKDKIEISHEGYELKFLGKSYAKMLASLDTETVIIPNDAHNSLPLNVNSENVYISGDNLDGLKHLLKSYAGQVKCIYIDPPYNTGTDGFVYNDKFDFTVNDLTTKLSIDEEQAQRILDLTKRGSASHSAWLMFIYPRLQLARDLLTNDGVVFISIDSNEISNLQIICNDIFGEENKIAQLVWKKRNGGGNDSFFVAVDHEYVLVYARNASKDYQKSKWRIPYSEDYLTRYSETDDNGYRYYWDTLARDGLRNPILLQLQAPDGSIITINSQKSEDTVKEELEKGWIRITKGANGWMVHHRIYQPEGRVQRSIIDDAGTNTNSSNEITQIFGFDAFDYAKPSTLIQRLIEMLPLKEGDLIVDFFSGSGTTGESVLKLGLHANLHFILVQLPENLDLKAESCSAEEKRKTEKIINFLDSVERPHTLDQIGIERLIRAAKKIRDEKSGTTADLGFKHYTLQEVSHSTLDKMESFENSGFVKDTTVYDEFGANTVLTTWLVRDGYGFNSDVEMVDLEGYTAYWCRNHLYFINPGITENAIKALIEKFNSQGSFNPQNIVLFGYSFNFVEMENLKTNVKILRDSEKNLKINLDIRY